MVWSIVLKWSYFNGMVHTTEVVIFQWYGPWKTTGHSHGRVKVKELKWQNKVLKQENANITSGAAQAQLVARQT